MLSVTICGDTPVIQKQFVSVKKLEIEGIPITVGLMETSAPTYDLKVHVNQSHVLLKVRAFSRGLCFCQHLSGEWNARQRYLSQV